MERANIAKNKFFLAAVVIAVLNPMSGLILGLIMLSEPDLRREGIVVAVFSLAWGILSLALFAKFRHLLPGL